MYISFNYAVGNIPTLPRDVMMVAKNFKKVISTFCDIAAALSNQGYGMKQPQQNQYPNPGITKAEPQQGTPMEEKGPVGPPSEEGVSAVGPPLQQENK